MLPPTTPPPGWRPPVRTCGASSAVSCGSARCRSSLSEVDPGIVAGQRIEEILREIHHDDAEGARLVARAEEKAGGTVTGGDVESQLDAGGRR